MNKKNRFPAIDILRGFAALSVIVYHVIELYGWESYPKEGLAVWFRIGWMGVDLFFVISGFVIALSAFSEIDKFGNSSYRRTFLIRRVRRIVPLHYLTMLVFLIFVMPAFLFENFYVNLLSHLLFVHNFSPRLHGSLNGVNWSLATEMQFYLLVALIGPLLKKASSVRLMLGFFLISWSWRLLSVLFLTGSTSETFPIFVASTQLPGMLDEFGIGIVLAKLVRSERGKVLIDYLNSSPYRVLICWLFTWVVIWMTLKIFWSFTYWDNPIMVIFFRTLIGISCGFLLFSTIILYANKALPNLLNPLIYIGTISYGLYLWHLGVILSLKRVEWLQASSAVYWVIALSSVLAIVSWHFFEKPLMEVRKC